MNIDTNLLLDTKCARCGMFLLDTPFFPDERGDAICEVCFTGKFQKLADNHLKSKKKRKRLSAKSLRKRKISVKVQTPPPPPPHAVEEDEEPVEAEEDTSPDSTCMLPAQAHLPPSQIATSIDEAVKTTVSMRVSVRAPAKSSLCLPRQPFYEVYGREIAIGVVTAFLAAFTYLVTSL